MTMLVLVSAPDEAALAAEARRVVAYLDRVPDASLLDVAYACALRRGGPSVLAVVSDSTADLRARLVSAATRLAGGIQRRIRDKSGTYYFRDHLLGPGGGKLALLYPGVTGFYPDMLRDLAVLDPECRGAFDELEEAMADDPNFRPSDFIYPPADRYRRDADIFRSGAYAQALVATYAACVAMTRLAASCGLSADGAAGFAGGDLAAMVLSGAAGGLPARPDRIRLIREIYRIVDKAVTRAGLPEAAMVSLLLRREGEADAVLASFPKGAAQLALDFSPRQKTFAIDPAYADTALAAFANAGVRAFRLALDRPFNTPLAEKLVPAIRKFTDAWMRHDATRTVYSCATAEPVPDGLRAARKETANRWAKPVRFTETIRRMYADGYRVFLEAGPRGLMTAAVADTLRDVDHAAIAFNSMHRRGVLQAEHALAQLAALGAAIDITHILRRLGAHEVDLDSSFGSARRESEMRLSREFPRLKFLSEQQPFGGVAAYAPEPRGRGAKVAARQAAIARQMRRQRQLDFGAVNPLVSDADVVEQAPGVMIELKKTFTFREYPFIADSAIGSSQLSYADPNLKGLVLLTLPLGIEIMAETAGMISPNRILAAVDAVSCRRSAAFRDGALTLRVRAERIASDDPGRATFRVMLRDDMPGDTYTSPVMEATFTLAKEPPVTVPIAVEPQTNPRVVHWSSRDIYPVRLCYGPRLRNIRFVESWAQTGLDYEINVPTNSGCVACTRFPLWEINPLLVQSVVSGFQLWRSHDRFQGAFSTPFRIRRLEWHAAPPQEGAVLRCYLRLRGVTPKSLICDIDVSDGNGNAVLSVRGWEEYAVHIDVAYRDLVMQPATAFVTKALDPALLGNPSVEAASAFITNVPYALFARNGEVWLKIFSHVVLGERERTAFREMTGSPDRRTEWLFGRIAAKEAVRRFLIERYQARWSSADVTVQANASGKPYVLGAWQDLLPGRVDIAIAHTAEFIVALAAANARVGVDVERAARDLSAEFAEGVFAHGETELAAANGNASVSLLRFWCAKEAVSKALGTGIRFPPKELVVAGYQPETGSLAVRLEGAWADAFRTLRGRDIPVTVRLVRDHVLAFCFIPASLLESEDDA